MWGNHLLGGGPRSPQDFSSYSSNEDFLQRCESLWEKADSPLRCRWLKPGVSTHLKRPLNSQRQFRVSSCSNLPVRGRNWPLKKLHRWGIKPSNPPGGDGPDPRPTNTPPPPKPKQIKTKPISLQPSIIRHHTRTRARPICSVWKKWCHSRNEGRRRKEEGACAERDDKWTSCVFKDSLPAWHQLRWWMSVVSAQKCLCASSACTTSQVCCVNVQIRTVVSEKRSHVHVF